MTFKTIKFDSWKFVSLALTAQIMREKQTKSISMYLCIMKILQHKIYLIQTNTKALSSLALSLSRCCFFISMNTKKRIKYGSDSIRQKTNNKKRAEINTNSILTNTLKIQIVVCVRSCSSPSIK